MDRIKRFFNQEIGEFQGWHIRCGLKGKPEPHDIVAVFGVEDRKTNFAECAVRNFLSEENRNGFTPDELEHLQAAQDSYQAALNNLQNLPGIKSREELRNERLANSPGHANFLSTIAAGLAKK